jgi:regulator of sigma E protease
MEETGLLFHLWDFAAYTAAPFVVVLGVMIFVHELGHFVAARAVGVRVLVFKLGFGKYIFSFRRGHTEYGVGWIPLGGYVRLFGDPTEIEGEDQDTPLDEISEVDKAEALHYRPAGHKFLTFFAGPLMNVILAFILAPIIFLRGVPEIPPLVGLVEENSPAMAAGILPGDRVLSIGGKQVKSFEELRWEEALNPEKTMAYEINRQGERIELSVRLRKSENEKIGPIGESGIGLDVPAGVGGVVPGSPAEEAGLLVGDTIMKINDKNVAGWSQLVDMVNGSNGSELSFIVQRQGEALAMSIAPRFNEEAQRFMIGISQPVVEMELVKYAFGPAVVKGYNYCLDNLAKVYLILWKLVSFQLSPKVMAGPLGIGAITSSAAHAGLTALIGLTVLISINLGILNLLPFPPLDGGHILFTALEGIFRREINMKWKEMTFRVGFALLIMLMLLVTVNDFLRYKTDMWNFVKEIGKGLGIG